MTGERPPAVFAGLTQEELDRAYDQAAWAANGLEIQERIAARSAAVAQSTPPLTRRYGLGDMQFIDLFVPAKADGAPVFILIHGGAWRLSMRQAFHGPAPTITAAGGILAIVGFDCIPTVRLPDMAGQIQDAIRWIGCEITAFGGDARNLHLIGHSSGAHLAAVMVAAGLPGVRSATLISGLYELEPVMLSARRLYLGLTAEETEALSPIRHVGAISAKCSVWWGSGDSPEFKRQSEAFAEALRDTGHLTRAAMLPDRNHFEMLEELENPESPIVQAMLAAVRC
jgi:arylformamidase